jgi:DNA transformation protein and related proteins
MPLSPGFIDFALELIAGFGKVEVKKMFGGASLTRGGVGFGILDNDTFFLKGDAAFGVDMKKQGSKPWSYSIGKDGRPREIAFWSLPHTALDDPDEASAFAKRSFAIAQKAAAEKAKSGKAKKAAKPKPAAKAVKKATPKPAKKKK